MSHKLVENMNEAEHLLHRQKENARKKRRADENRFKSPRRSTKKLVEKVEQDLSRSLITTEIVAIERDERQKAFTHFFFKYNGNVAAACTSAGVTRATFDSWLKRCPEISQQITDVNEAMLDLAEQQLLRNISLGKENSLFFFLCNKGKHRGWQDVRKLSAPRMKAININIGYFGEKREKPEVKMIESSEVKLDEEQVD